MRRTVCFTTSGNPVSTGTLMISLPAGLSSAFMKQIADNLAKSKYHQNFYDQSLGPSVGRVVNDVTAEIAGGSMTPQAAATAIQAAWKQGN